MALKQTTYDDVSQAESAFADTQTAYLRQFGWSYASQNPGGRWLWSRTIDGKTYYVDADTAIYMTRHSVDV